MTNQSKFLRLALQVLKLIHLRQIVAFCLITFLTLSNGVVQSQNFVSDAPNADQFLRLWNEQQFDGSLPSVANIYEFEWSLSQYPDVVWRPTPPDIPNIPYITLPTSEILHDARVVGVLIVTNSGTYLLSNDDSGNLNLYSLPEWICRISPHLCMVRNSFGM